MIIIYDGVCGFCNAWVLFVLDNHPNQHIRFVSFQSEKAIPFLEKYEIQNLDSIVCIDKENCYTKSDAILKILGMLDSHWRYLRFLAIVPKRVRNGVYNIIAKNRYKIIKKNHYSCRMLTLNEKQMFLD